MKVTLVHPDNKDQKVVATHPQQVAAYTQRGFVEAQPEKPAAAPKAKSQKEAK